MKRAVFASLGVVLAFVACGDDDATPGAGSSSGTDGSSSGTTSTSGTVGSSSGTQATSGGTSGNPVPPTNLVEILTPGKFATATGVLAVGRAGHVLLATGESTSLDTLHLWKDGASTPIAMATGITFTVNPVNVSGCVTPEGHAAFFANTPSGGHVAFFNGTTVVDTTIPNGVAAAWCAGGDRVLASPQTAGSVATENWLYTPAGGKVAVTKGAGDRGASVNASGRVAMNAGTSKDGTFTEYPANLGLTPLAINAGDLITGSVIKDLKISYVTYKVGEPAVTALAECKDSKGNSAVPNDINDAGDILFRSGDEWFFRKGTTSDCKTVDLKSLGYKVSGAVGIDAQGRVYLKAKKENDSASKVVGLVVSP